MVVSLYTFTSADSVSDVFTSIAAVSLAICVVSE